MSKNSDVAARTFDSKNADKSAGLRRALATTNWTSACLPLQTRLPVWTWRPLRQHTQSGQSSTIPTQMVEDGPDCAVRARVRRVHTSSDRSSAQIPQCTFVNDCSISRPSF
jgi:hypothetical protein